MAVSEWGDVCSEKNLNKLNHCDRPAFGFKNTTLGDTQKSPLTQIPATKHSYQVVAKHQSTTCTVPLPSIHVCYQINISRQSTRAFANTWSIAFNQHSQFGRKFSVGHLWIIMKCPFPNWAAICLLFSLLTFKLKHRKNCRVIVIAESIVGNVIIFIRLHNVFQKPRVHQYPILRWQVSWIAQLGQDQQTMLPVELSWTAKKKEYPESIYFFMPDLMVRSWSGQDSGGQMRGALGRVGSWDGQCHWAHYFSPMITGEQNRINSC